MEITYICAQTGQKIISSTGLPDGWVIPSYSLAGENKENPIPQKYTMIAFSSKTAMDRYIETNMSEKF
jgi:hypothetical protein